MATRAEPLGPTTSGSRSSQRRGPANRHDERRSLFITSKARGVQHCLDPAVDLVLRGGAVHGSPALSGTVVSRSVSSLGVRDADRADAHGARTARLANAGPWSINSSRSSQADSYSSTSNGRITIPVKQRQGRKISAARCHHVAAEEAGCRQTRPAHPRYARPTRTATESSNCCAPPSPTADSTRSNSTSGWTRRWPPARSTRWPRSPPI
jgi:hypothetical protein